MSDIKNTKLNLFSPGIKISPSIITGDLMNLEREIRSLEACGVDYIHLDVMDGHFVPHLTIGVPVVAQMKKITSLPLDVHIMVQNTDAVFEHYLNAGADILTFQIETCTHAHRVCNKIREQGCKVGIALNPSTHWHAVQNLLPFIDIVMVMTVNPGFSNQSHIPEIQQKIVDISQYCKEKNYKVAIEIDGGVNSDNISALTQKGATIFVAGGAIFNQKDYASAVNKLRAASKI